jgi:hypothetical protein
MRHAWSQAELDLVSSKCQRAKWYLAIHRPQILAYYEVVSTPVDHPVSAIDVLNVSGSQFVDGGHTVWVGTASGASDLGAVRLRRPPSEWDGPFMPVMESGSGLVRWNEATHMTVVDEYRPWVKHPRYNTATSQWNWDYDYTDAGQLKIYPPMAVMGAPFVGILNNNQISGSFVGEHSLAFDQSISSYTWTFPDGRNYSYNGTETSPLVVGFTGASPFGNYAKLAVVDSGAASHVGKRLMFAFDDLSSLPRVAFTSITGGKNQGGYVTQIQTYGLDDTSLPPGTEIIIFEAASYGNTACEMGGNSPFRQNVVFRGWITNEQITKDPNTGMAIITAETIDGIMKNQPSYDTFYVQTSPVPSSSEIIGTYNLSLDRVAFNHMRWRSTVGDICDFYPASGLAMSLHPVYQNLPRGSWWEQLRTNYYERGMLWGVGSDMQSNIFSYEDINITGTSANYTAFPQFNSRNFGGQISIERVYHDTAAQVKMYAVASTTPFGAESPGNVLGYAGGNVEHTQGLMVDTQDRLITWSGNWRAKQNAEFKRVVTPLAGNLRIDPIPNAIIPFTIASDRNARKLNWSNKLFIPQDVTINYNIGRGVTTELVSEEVVNGKGGSSITFPVITALPPPDPEDNPPPPGPSVGSDVVYVMGANHLGRTRNFGANHPVWDDVPIPSVTRCYDFILDPWNPKNGGWLSTTQGLYRTSNLDSAVPSWTQVLSKSGIESSTGRSDYGSGYKIIGSINKQGYFAFFFLVYTAGEQYLYCAYTSNNGTTWGFSEVSNFSLGDWGGAADYVPHLVSNNVVLYAAGIEVINSPTSARPEVFRSMNGGVTWSSVGSIGSFVTAGNATPFSVHCPYNDNSDGLDVYVANVLGVYKSINGSTFSSLGITPQTNINRTSIETYTQDQKIVYIWDSSDNIRVSTNNAISFDTRGSVPGTLKAAGGFPFNSQRYYAVSNTGIYASFDGGNSFVDKTNNFPVSELSPSASYNKAVIVPVWVS